MGSFRSPPPPPFRIEHDVGQTDWLDERLDHDVGLPATVGFIVPSGYDAYARILHPAQRLLGLTYEERAPLRWSEIADARGKTMHPEVALDALIDHRDTEDDNYWKAITIGDGTWMPAREGTLDATDAAALVSILRGATTTSDDAWFMLWNGYGDLGPWMNDLPVGVIHRASEPPDVPAALEGGIWAFRHYIVLRGPLDALPTWFGWLGEGHGPNYWWPEDRAWIVATEIDGYSTYVGGSRDRIEAIVESPLMEALPSDLSHRFDGWNAPDQ